MARFQISKQLVGVFSGDNGSIFQHRSVRHLIVQRRSKISVGAVLCGVQTFHHLILPLFFQIGQLLQAVKTHCLRLTQ